jgi:hypothetical protein
MNLLELRQQFMTISGRVDLVGSAGENTGANFYINEGRKFLDRLDETSKSWGSCFRFINIGYYIASIPMCRAIKEVWATTTTARWQLKKKNLQDLISEYLCSDPAARTNGLPLYYSPTITTYIPPSVEVGSMEAFIQWVEIPSGDAHEYNTIILNVPAEEKLSVDIKGLYYSAELSADTDKNHWTVNHPLLLIMAAMRAIEIVNRNTQGVNDWNNSIATEIKQLGMDLVEELIAESSQMEG